MEQEWEWYKCYICNGTLKVPKGISKCPYCLNCLIKLYGPYGESEMSSATQDFPFRIFKLQL